VRKDGPNGEVYGQPRLFMSRRGKEKSQKGKGYRMDSVFCEGGRIGKGNGVYPREDRDFSNSTRREEVKGQFACADAHHLASRVPKGHFLIVFRACQERNKRGEKTKK